MPYFHVLVTVKDAPDSIRCVLADLSEREIEANFVKPYGKEESILCGNEIIDAYSLKTVRIIQTSDTSEAERSKLKDEHNRKNEEFNRSSDSLKIIGSGFRRDDEDIAEAGNDVTTEYVTGVPGYLDRKTAVARLFLDKLVVPIAVALIVAAALLWSGLKRT